jgi:hypothetical protein
MQIQVNNDFTTDGQFTQAQINSFLQDEQTAINILDSTFTNNITVTFNIGFGSCRGLILNDQTISEGDANTAAGFFLSYSQLRNDLLTFGQPGFFNAANLPAGNSINGVSNFWVSSGVGTCFGLFTNAVDGFVGIGTGFTPGAQRVSAFLHEIGHAMGRVPENNGTSSSELDLWRFVSQGNRLFDGRTDPIHEGTVPAAYFSINGGVTDLADWGQNSDHWGQNSDPSDFRGPGSNPPSNRTPNDPIDEIVGNLGQLTTVDIECMEALGFRTVTNPPPPPLPSTPPDWYVAGTGNFDGTGNSSILWRDGSGQDLLWFIQNGRQVGGVNLPTVPNGWNVGGIGDFNNDGAQDILWHNASGQNIIWLMQNDNIYSGAILPSTGASWVIGGVGNFDQDGTRNIFWTNASTGQNLIWDIDHSTLVGGANLPTTPLSWKPVGVGVNFDNERTIFWHDASGQNLVWMINDDRLTTSYNLPATPTSWHVAGIGAFNNDTLGDVFWHNDSGQNLIWFIQNGQMIGGVNLPTTPTSFIPAGVGDFNGDGTTDILWHDAGGQNLIWTMHNGQIAGGSSGAGASSNGGAIDTGADMSQLVQAMASFAPAAASPLGAALSDAAVNSCKISSCSLALIELMIDA